MSEDTQLHAPERVTDLLVQAYRLLEDAQAHADRWQKGNIGSDLNLCRWMLGQTMANIARLTSDHTLKSTTQEWELDGSPAFSIALDEV